MATDALSARYTSMRVLIRRTRFFGVTLVFLLGTLHKQDTPWISRGDPGTSFVTFQPDGWRKSHCRHRCSYHRGMSY
jgi:hypothetical protein